MVIFSYLFIYSKYKKKHKQRVKQLIFNKINVLNNPVESTDLN